MNLAFEISLLILRSDLLYAITSYDMGPKAVFPLRRKVSSGFLLPLKIHRICGV
jgi:hypothetical protein